VIYAWSASGSASVVSATSNGSRMQSERRMAVLSKKRSRDLIHELWWASQYGSR
jgi:hypothetical protein